MGEIKLGANEIGKIFLGDTRILGGLCLEVKDNAFEHYVNTVTFINNSNEEITVRIEGFSGSFEGSLVLNDSVDICIPVKTVLVRPSFAREINAAGRPCTRLTILTNIRYTSYSFVNFKSPSVYSMKALSNIENIVDNSLNVFDYYSSPRWGGSFVGTFIFNN